ncbi:kelch-like protein 3 isoform X2 [Rhodamnia argentea]|uniref:Kelch-like protein 3 isoform X2 n=1 Tax=Rhodamnia argentea TaxID=178133 RepID=A0ABM3GS75_9MYRT|nr:kelch-like protein 3 isoform X2 [Rhodamnia argentea]
MGTVKNRDTYCGNTPFSPVIPCGVLAHRNLGKNNLGGVIFGCKENNLKECLSKQLFGLPSSHIAYVNHIEPGLPLFLFNYSDRKLHGIFEAASRGQMNIDPYCWSTDVLEKTPYPAQVQIRIRMQCQPLHEDQFKRIIADNYHTYNHFWFELDHAQTSKLISLFASLAIAPSIPQCIIQRRKLSQPLSTEETRGEWEKMKHFTSKAKKLEHSSGRSDSADPYLSVEVDDQLFEGCASMKRDGGDEEDSIIMKLKELALSQEYCDLDMNHCSGGGSSTEGIKSEENSFVEAPVGPEEKKLRDSHSSGDLEEKKLQDIYSSSDYRLTIAQELGELKDFKLEQTQKMIKLEQKLDWAENEICYLRDHCNLLDSLLKSSSHSSVPEEIQSSEELDLDLKDSIIIVGGYDGSSWLSAVYSYFPSHNVVKSLKPMNCIRAYASVAKFKEELFVFGGGDGESWHDTVESYNSAENKWTVQPSLNAKKGSLAGAVSMGKIFALGGGNGQDCFSDVEMLDFDIGKWICTRSMLQKRFALAAVELNGVIYATGGYDGNNYLNSAERFDPREHSWTKIGSLTTKRGCHSLVSLNEQLYALGGFDGNSMVASVEVYDPRLDCWMVGEPMNCARGYSAAAVLNESIYVIGGVKDDEGVVDIVECYKEGQSWHKTIVRDIGQRCFLSAIVL